MTRAAAAAAVALAALTGAVRAQQRGIDVQDYHFSVVLPDTGAVIRVSATIGFRREPGAGDTLALDLVGMTMDSVVNSVTVESLRFAYDGRVLRVPIAREREQSLIVTYHGVDPYYQPVRDPERTGRPSVRRTTSMTSSTYLSASPRSAADRTQPWT